MNRRVVHVLAISFLLSGCAVGRVSENAIGHVTSTVEGLSGSVFGHAESAVEPDVPPSSLLAGQWTPVGAQMGGHDMPVSSFGGATLNLTTTTYEFAGDRGSYMVVYAGSPARMDIQGEQGPNAGRTIPTLYQLSGGDLTIAYQLGPGVRPRDFTSPPGTKILVIHYRRAH